MKRSQDLQALATESVRDYILRAGHDEFPRASDATCPAKIGKGCEAFNGAEQCHGHVARGIRVLACDIRS